MIKRGWQKARDTGDWTPQGEGMEPRGRFRSHPQCSLYVSDIEAPEVGRVNLWGRSRRPRERRKGVTSRLGLGLKPLLPPLVQEVLVTQGTGAQGTECSTHSLIFNFPIHPFRESHLCLSFLGLHLDNRHQTLCKHGLSFQSDFSFYCYVWSSAGSQDSHFFFFFALPSSFLAFHYLKRLPC